jgi:hypothetical protein
MARYANGGLLGPGAAPRIIAGLRRKGHAVRVLNHTHSLPEHVLDLLCGHRRYVAQIRINAVSWPVLPPLRHILSGYSALRKAIKSGWLDQPPVERRALPLANVANARFFVAKSVSA